MKSKVFISSVLLLLLIQSPIHAQITNPAISAGLGTAATTADAATIVAVLLARFFSAALGLGTVFFLVYFVINSFRWLTAGGDSGNIQAARQGLIDAILGIIILASVFAIANLIAPILGLSTPACQFPQQICWPTF